MSVTLTPTPDPHSFVRDPLWAYFLCNGYTDASSDTSGCIITIAEVAVVGDTLRLVWNGLDLTFICAYSLDDSGLTYLLPAISSTDEHASSLAAALRNNYYVNRDFYVLPVGSVIALVPYPNVNLPEMEQVAFTPGTRASSITLTTGGDPYVLPANYRVGVRVQVYQPDPFNAWKALPETSSAPVLNDDLDPIARIDIHELLRPFVKTTWPSRNMSLPQQCLEHTVAYCFEYWEIKGDPAVPGVMARFGDFTTPKTAWNGGLRTAEHFLADDLFDLITAGDDTAIFLTWRGRRGKHKVQQGEEHMLGLYCDADGTYTLQAQVYTPDERSSTGWEDTVNGTMDAGEVWVWPTGFDRLGLGALVPDVADYDHYAVRVVNEEGDPVSETHVFHLAPPNYQRRYLRWENSLGIVESLSTVGGWEEGVAMTNTEVIRAIGIEATAIDGAFYNIPEGCQGTLKLSTGYLPVGEIRALADILNSRKLLLWDAERGVEVACRLNAGEFRLRGKGDAATENLYALNLELLLEDPDTEFSDARVFTESGVLVP